MGFRWKTTKADTLPALEPGGKIRSGDAGLQQQGKGMVKLLPSHFVLKKREKQKATMKWKKQKGIIVLFV
ncbi:MAG: hypothetical protein L0J40_04015 [Alkalibacterium sp.]|jgi:hypothetical protein|nr:hypothetical protein [Staphylococcus equorum]MDN6293778.1 hypothetical protein [Alkalibacterium sp.]